jgi:hypothetical protein
MADITKCSGEGCPFKQDCYRFTADASDYQSWFMEVPIKDDECDMFWGVQNDYTMKQIKDILNGR